jgi:hypothetical protein
MRFKVQISDALCRELLCVIAHRIAECEAEIDVLEEAGVTASYWQAQLSRAEEARKELCARMLWPVHEEGRAA